jgi:hypothetical protein
MSESTNLAARERREALVGEWTMEAKPPAVRRGPAGGGSPSSGSRACPC